MVNLTSEAIFRNWGKVTDDKMLPVTGLVLSLALALLPFIGPSNYLLHIAVLAFVYITLGLGLNIVVGLAGLLDLGYVAFYAVGAYTYALLSAHYQIPFLLALAVGAGLSAIVGVILGWPTIRTRGDYLALVTLGFGEMIRLLLRNWNSLTNGPRGLMNVPAPRLGSVVLSTPLHFYYLGLLLAMFALAISWRVKGSVVGLQLAAIKDDEDAAAAIGINPVRWKLYAFALGAFMAGLAGVFFASWQQFVSPESFTLGESILILSIVVLGGMGGVWPTVGAACFLVLLPEALRGLETYRFLVLGLLLVLVVIVQERLRLVALNKRRNAPGVDLGSVTAALPPSEDNSFSKKDSTGRLLLSVAKVSKHFGGVRALEDVSLNVNSGEIVGLVGANGAGKTTLFSCISGALRADVGKISLHRDGGLLDISVLPPFQIARKGVVRTFQSPRLFQSLSVSGNVGLGKRCSDIPPFWEPFLPVHADDSADDRSASSLLRSIGGPLPEASVDGMSFVDQKLTELARAIATQPAVLLLDEPVSGMEPASRQRLAQVLRWANEALGITLIIVEHDLGFLESLCTRIVVMNRGQVVADGPPLDPSVAKAIDLNYAVSN